MNNTDTNTLLLTLYCMYTVNTSATMYNPNISYANVVVDMSDNTLMNWKTTVSAANALHVVPDM